MFELICVTREHCLLSHPFCNWKSFIYATDGEWSPEFESLNSLSRCLMLDAWCLSVHSRCSQMQSSGISDNNLVPCDRGWNYVSSQAMFRRTCPRICLLKHRADITLKELCLSEPMRRRDAQLIRLLKQRADTMLENVPSSVHLRAAYALQIFWPKESSKRSALSRRDWRHTPYLSW